MVNLPRSKVTETSRKGIGVLEMVCSNWMCLFWLLQWVRKSFKLSSPSVQIIKMSSMYLKYRGGLCL